MSRKHTLRVAHESDFEKLLKSLGVYEKITSSEMSCAVCGQLMSVAQISVVYAEEAEVKVCCSNIECMEKMTRK